MKIYLAYKFAGEDPERLVKSLRRIAEILENAGHEVYFAFKDSDLFEKKKFSEKQILIHALKELDNSDCLFVFVKSSEKAEGMLIEIGYALAKKKKIILAIKKSVNLYFTESIADKKIEFSDIDDLCEKLKGVK